jgi:hypothetical protein
MRRDELGLADRGIGTAASNLGRALLQTGDTVTALQNMEEARQVFLSVLGPIHPQTLLERVQMATVLAKRGSPDVAEEMVAEIRSDLGSDPPPAGLERRLAVVEELIERDSSSSNR